MQGYSRNFYSYIISTSSFIHLWTSPLLRNQLKIEHVNLELDTRVHRNRKTKGIDLKIENDSAHKYTKIEAEV